MQQHYVTTPVRENSGMGSGFSTGYIVMGDKPLVVGGCGGFTHISKRYYFLIESSLR